MVSKETAKAPDRAGRVAVFTNKHRVLFIVIGKVNESLASALSIRFFSVDAWRCAIAAVTFIDAQLYPGAELSGFTQLNGSSARESDSRANCCTHGGGSVSESYPRDEEVAVVTDQTPPQNLHKGQM